MVKADKRTRTELLAALRAAEGQVTQLEGAKRKEFEAACEARRNQHLQEVHFLSGQAKALAMTACGVAMRDPEVSEEWGAESHLAGIAYLNAGEYPHEGTKLIVVDDGGNMLTCVVERAT